MIGGSLKKLIKTFKRIDIYFKYERLRDEGYKSEVEIVKGVDSI